MSRTQGLIENLPGGMLRRGAGRRRPQAACAPATSAALPPELAGYCAPHVYVQDLTVRAALEGKRDLVHRAAALDRHATSVLSIAEIRAWWMN